jgi:serine protease Do
MDSLKRIMLPVLSLGLVSVSASPLQSTQPNLLAQQQILLDTSHALNEIARKSTAAVVSITSIKSQELQANPLTSPNGPSGDHGGDPGGDRMLMGIGSGVIVKPEGVILTNQHVVQDAEKVTVMLDEKTKATAHVLGTDTSTDLAIIQLDKKPQKDLPVINFGDSDQVQVGDWAIAVGSPFGLNRTMTTGIVSAIGRARLGMLDIENFIQTDAAINPGNSGGPLINARGQMIGVNTAIFSQNGGFIGIGFAIPSKIAKTVYDEIMDHGRVIRGWMGVAAQDLDEDLASYFNRSTDHGALVSQILPRGPAAQANIQVGDVITKFGEAEIDSANQLKTLVAKTKADSRIPVEFYREGKGKKMTITIREQPHPKKAQAQLAGQAGSSKSNKIPHFGLAVEDIPPEFTDLFGIPPKSGALIAGVIPGSPAFDAGLDIGDIILSANKSKIKGAKDFFDFVREQGKSDLAVFYVQKGPEEKVFIPVRSKAKS